MVAGHAVQPVFDGIAMANAAGALISGRLPAIVSSRDAAANRAQNEFDDIALDGLDMLQSIDICRVRGCKFRPIIADTAC